MGRQGMQADTVVVGAGIVGSAVAAELVGRREVLVVDAGTDSLAGSTGHAPGFLGEFGGAQVATELATLTTGALDRLAGDDPQVFLRTGCLEVATTGDGAAVLAERAATARTHGLEVAELSPADAARLAPETVPTAGTVAAIHFPGDATADAAAAAARLRDQATAQGAGFEWGVRVAGVRTGRGHATVETTDGRTITARDVVLCTGIWGDLGMTPHGVLPAPIVPVRHPYVYGPLGHDAPGQRPFVRFPEHHVYARWHGDRWGFGTYDHTPDPIDAGGLTKADLPWDGRFDAAVERGQGLLARPELFAPAERLDGVFAVTPDNLPLVGRWDDHVWMAAAVWVTHSLGAARLLAAQIEGQPAPVTDPATLDPRRFDDWEPETARDAALRHYNDIYERG